MAYVVKIGLLTNKSNEDQKDGGHSPSHHCVCPGYVSKVFRECGYSNSKKRAHDVENGSFELLGEILLDRKDKLFDRYD